jgi:adenylate cyclase
MNLTLRQVFVLTLAALLLLLGALLYIVYDGTRRSILEGAKRLQQEAATRITEGFTGYLGSAEKTLADVGGQLAAGALRPDDPGRLEAALRSIVQTNDNLAEATLTYADRLQYTKGAEFPDVIGSRGQFSVYRAGDATNRIITRRVFTQAGGFVADVQDDGTTLRQPAADPTDHPTFQTLVWKERYGKKVWSDLHWSQVEQSSSPGAPPTTSVSQPASVPATSPAAARRAEVTVQQAIVDPAGKFIGVLRVGLLTSQLDHIAQRSRGFRENADGGEAHVVFVCDTDGRLVTRCGPEDCLTEMGDDLRYDPAHAAPPVATALKLSALSQVAPWQAVPAEFTVGGRKYLVTFQQLPHAQAQDWVVGVLAPEDLYLKDFIPARNRLLVGSMIVIGLILLGGVLTLRAVQRGLSRVVSVTTRIRDFDFRPTQPAAQFRDLRAVLESIEQTKTAIRAMGKYVPVGLVRDLYSMNREPLLGGDVTDVSLMFTDIMGFTGIAERLSSDPDGLATALGEYFAALAYAVHANDGIVDKFIGDAVMALWNVPHPVADHPRRACAAALACLRATRQVAESPRWRDLPPLVTRIGLHRDRVMVGHFGAPDRLSYTAMGDGVNLASRLESLNKQYGTTVIASETIRDAAGAAYRFRMLDTVVVKGKTRGSRIYELRGPLDEPDPKEQVIARYEEALLVYQKREFAAAEAILAPQEYLDPPSRVLAERCRLLAIDPPPADWDGVYVASVK